MLCPSALDPSSGAHSNYLYFLQLVLTLWQCRAQRVSEHFPNSLGVDDFVHRLEIALYQFGFSGENSIGEPDSCGMPSL